MNEMRMKGLVRKRKIEEGKRKKWDRKKQTKRKE
jgi:hypothetical protein